MTARAAPRHWLVLFVLVGASYALGSQLAFSWFGADGLSSSFFPAAGVTLAALLLVPRRRWAVVLAAAGLAELTVDLLHDLDLAPTLGYVVANLTQPLVGALLLGLVVERVDLGRTRDLTAFLALAVVAAPAVGGALGAAAFVLLDGGDGFLRFAAEWWVGDGLGVLVVGGAILALTSTSPRPLPRGRVGTGIVLGAAAVAATAVVFRLERFGFVYVPIVLLTMVAFRIGTRGVALTGAAVSFVAAEATAGGSRYWEALEIMPQTGLLYLQLGLGVLVAAALALASEIAGRERAALELARRESEMSTALERAALFESERAAREQAQLLGQSAAKLAAASSAEEVATATVSSLEEAGIPIAAVEVLTDAGGGPCLRALASVGISRRTVDGLRDYPLEADTPGAEAVRTGRAVAVPTAREFDARFPGMASLRREHRLESVVSIPLRSVDGRVLGALAVAATEPYRFDEERLQLVTAVAGQTGLALDRASLLEREREARDRAELLQAAADRAAESAARLYERERDVSHTLQMGLLGGELQPVPGTVIATAYRPGTASLEVGGDWYDAFPLRDGRLALVVGDVVGHGLDAAVAMGQLRGAVRALAPSGSPRAELAGLDEVVASLPAAAMATIAYGELDLASGRLVFACAGHPPPLLVPSGGEPRLLWGGRSLPLGSSFRSARIDAVADLEPGDAIVFYTDGLVERRRQAMDVGLASLVRATAHDGSASPATLVERILGTLPGEQQHADDVCVLAIQRPLPAHSLAGVPGGSRYHVRLDA